MSENRANCPGPGERRSIHLSSAKQWTRHIFYDAMWSVKLKTLKKKTDFKKNDFIIHVAPSEIRWLTTIAAIDLEGIARFEIET